MGFNSGFKGLKTGEFLLSHQLSVMIFLRYIFRVWHHVELWADNDVFFPETSMSNSRELLSGQYPPWNPENL